MSDRTKPEELEENWPSGHDGGEGVVVDRAERDMWRARARLAEAEFERLRTDKLATYARETDRLNARVLALESALRHALEDMPVNYKRLREALEGK